MWLLDKLAQRYHTRPSELLGIEEEHTAYCLDEAVMVFCAGVQGKIDDVPEGKGKRASEKRQRQQDTLLKQLLRLPEEEEKPKFKDPAELNKNPF
mgnify:CR=1 FL=1